ncbi:B3 domain-containing transcription factor ABI3-like [Rutidosis leptorrhynchoides]|uniref:B3 domain-containing transcription factor ABI3-like n=1 Tax=Rutidosis leptorrhynchoides TaxID=125765 RepID=UPI003A9A175E
MYPKQKKVDVMEVYENIGEQEKRSTGFDALGTTMMTSTDDQRGIWEIDVRAQQQNLLHEMNDPSMFYNDQFPQIPDFPCMSSSSSSSSNPAPAKPISSATTTSSASSASSSTSSAQSWAVLKSEYVTEEEGDDELKLNKKKINLGVEESEGVPVMSTTSTVAERGGVPLPRPLETTDGSGTIDCMDVMENFGYMDLIDANDMWDPCSIFEQDTPNMQQEQGGGSGGNGRGNSNRSDVVQEGEEGDEGRLDELGTMFFDWLKSNKNVISAEDMRNIKLKKSTVECASKRLGSSKEGKKQLLKLILEWVQQHQLQRKNSGCSELLTAVANPNPNPNQYPLQQPYQGPPPQAPPPPPFNCNSWVLPGEMNHGFSPPPWIPPAVGYPSYMCTTDAQNNGMTMVASQPTPSFSYMGGGNQYNSGLNCNINPYGNQGSGEYQVLESAPSWNPSQLTMVGSPYNNQFPESYAPQIMPLASSYPEQYPYNPNVYTAGGGGEQRVMRLGSSATKEARKKRMARQRRTYFHHHNHSRQNHNNHHNNMANSDHQPMLVDDNCSSKSHGGGWMYWPSPTSTATVPPPSVEVPQRLSSRPFQSSGDPLNKENSTDKLHGLKTEKNLKFLLQKVLKQSDVGSLGRIVLPKKEAESHLPDLDSRDGISIAMEDIGTSQVWNMRYSLRFWPNNKSRMYLLENTGDFVKANGLQEGDFIVLYSDVKCGKYLIRGVRVRQPASGKPEVKKSVKRSYRGTSQSARSSPK